MSNPKQRIRRIKLSKNKVAIIFDKRPKYQPIVGDTISVGNLIATFKEKPCQKQH